MSRILLIGNSGLKKNANDGQTVKTRLYHKKMIDEGFDVFFVELDGFNSHPLSVFRKIIKGIKKCDRIVLLTAERGSKILIPFINFFNRKHKKPFVLPLIGIGVLHSVIDKLSEKEKNSFFLAENFDCYKKKKRIAKNLAKVDAILPETELIGNIFRRYFDLKNVFVLNNFREYTITKTNNFKPNEVMQVAYISRIWRDKGIFDLLDVVESINKNEQRIQLDVFGPKSLNDKEEKIFNSSVSNGNGIQYCGSIAEDTVIGTLSKYDLLAFPTRYFGEGTPGIISESLMAGTPILTSDFLQAMYLLEDGYDSVFFKMLDKNDLKNKLLFLLNNRKELFSMRQKALESGKKFTYAENRNVFLKYVCGVEK